MWVALFLDQDPNFSYLAAVEFDISQDKDDDLGYDLDKASILSCRSLH